MKPEKGVLSYRKIGFLIAGGILFYWMLNNFSSVEALLSFLLGLLFPITLGCIFAFLLNLPLRAIEKHVFRGHGGRFRRPLALIATLLLLGLLVFVVLRIIVPPLVSAVVQLSTNIPIYLARLQTWLAPYRDSLPPVVTKWLGDESLLQTLISEITQWLDSGLGDFLATAVGVATSVVGSFATFFLSLIITLYLLLDKEHLLAQSNRLLRAYVPEKKYIRGKEIASLTFHTYASFVSGQCIEAIILGSMFFVTLLIGGFDYALLISVVVGVTSLIPMIGAWIGGIVGAVLLLVSMGPMRMLVFIIITLVIQQIESNLIYPHVVGHSIGLPPLWILVAVIIGGGVGGIVGILFFIPLCSVLYTLARADVQSRLKKKSQLPENVQEIPSSSK